MLKLTSPSRPNRPGWEKPHSWVQTSPFLGVSPFRLLSIPSRQGSWSGSCQFSRPCALRKMRASVSSSPWHPGTRANVSTAWEVGSWGMGGVGVEEWGVWKGSLGQVPKVWPHSSLSHGCPFTGCLPTQGGLLKGPFVNRGDLLQDG